MRYIIILSGILFFSLSLKGQSHFLTGRLVCEETDCNLPPHCGVIAAAKAFKFEIIATSYETLSKYMLCIVSCPEFYGNSFFVKDRIYQVDLSEKNPHSISYSIFNDHSAEKLPMLWVTMIKADFILNEK